MKRILVSVEPEETRVALIVGGSLDSIEFERSTHEHIVGNIYKGSIENVLPGMQAAFVDIGTKKNAFLFLGDGKHHKAVLQNNQKIHIGQRIPVQIIKDAHGSKGPRASTHISLPGRYMVLMPNAEYIGVSRRITNESERKRLSGIAEKLLPKGMGLIVRTVAEGMEQEILKKDVTYLLHLWESISARFQLHDGGTLLYRDADLLIRFIRDRFTEEIDEFLVDDASTYERVRDFVKILSPDLLPRIKLYPEKYMLFHAYEIDKEIEHMGEREVPLHSGGFLVIDKTEAMTVIDVNTGKYTGKSNLGETVYRTNIEAAQEIAKQIRLRDIGGIILVDFIDMTDERQREELLDELRARTKCDPQKTNVVDITSLGLVEITRKKARSNFAELVYSDCPTCHGKGYVESAETVAIRISRSIRRMEAVSHARDGYEIKVHEIVEKYLQEHDLLAQLASDYGIAIKIGIHDDIHLEAYSILQMT